MSHAWADPAFAIAGLRALSVVGMYLENLPEIMVRNMSEEAADRFLRSECARLWHELPSLPVPHVWLSANHQTQAHPVDRDSEYAQASWYRLMESVAAEGGTYVREGQPVFPDLPENYAIRRLRNAVASRGFIMAEWKKTRWWPFGRWVPVGVSRMERDAP